MKLTIPISGRVGLQSIEDTLAAYYKRSLESPEVEFAIHDLQWIGHYPATLLYAWAATLTTTKRRNVSLSIPDRDNLSSQVHKSLLDFGVLRELKRLGVGVPYSTSPEPSLGISLTTIENKSVLWKTVSSISENLSHLQSLGDVGAEAVRDTVDVVLFELAENAFIHTNGGAPHFQISIATSAGPKSPHPGMVSVFDSGMQYAEVVLGDLGPGIEKRLEKQLPPDYEPPFVKKPPYTKTEKLLSYAFEFSSTSNIAGRKQRLKDLLINMDLDPAEVASGLFCVLGVVRSRGGQLIVRTPKCILGFDFTRDSNSPRMSGRRQLGIKSLARLPGTHYWLRIPLQPRRESSSIGVSQHFDTLIPDIQIVSAFSTKPVGTPIENILSDAIHTVELTLRKCGKKPGLLLIPPPRAPLPARALALFIGALRAIHHNKRAVMWLVPRAAFLTLEMQRPKDAPQTRAGISQQPVIIGQPFTQLVHLAFGGHIQLPWLQPKEGSKREFILHGDTLSRIRAIYCEWVRKELRNIAKTPIVRHADGTFLIEGKYYTNVFYEISQMVNSVETRSLLAQWICLCINPDNIPDLLITTTDLMRPVLEQARELFYEAYGKAPQVVAPKNTDAAALNISIQLLGSSGKTAILVSDVICRGVEFDELLSMISFLQVDAGFTVIDARSAERLGKPFLLGGEKPRSIPIIAVASESIPNQQQPTQTYTDDGEECTYVIDPVTKAPTLYVRSHIPRQNLNDILDTAVKESESLIHGHVSYIDKHYTFFLDFGRLFAAIRADIEAWIVEQLSAASRTVAEKPETLHVLLHNPDNSLAWTKEFIETSFPHAQVVIVTTDQLDAPPPPKPTRGTDWVILMPALASGELARKAIEYASRHHPHTILLLCVVSRMEPRHLSFMLQISEYRGAHIHVATLLNVPLPAYEPGKGTCPLCLLVSEFEHLHETVIHVLARENIVPLIAQAIAERIETNKAIRWITSDDALPNRAEHARDLDRARIRSLYQQALVDLSARRSLNEILVTSDDAVEVILQVISQEPTNPDFSLDTFHRLLYKAQPHIEKCVLALLANCEPPYQVSHTLPAIAMLYPAPFIEQAGQLLVRFAASRRDIEEICIQILLGKCPIQDAGKVMAAVRATAGEETHRIIDETMQFVGVVRKPKRQEIEEVCKLWSIVARTNQYTDSIDRLTNITLEAPESLLWVKNQLSAAVTEWYRSVSPLVSHLRSNTIWHNLVSDRVIGCELAPLEAIGANLSQLSKTLLSPGEEEKYVAEIVSASRRAQSIHNYIRKYIYTFLVNPLQGDQIVALASAEATLHMGEKQIIVTSEIDRNVGLVLCDLSELDAACRAMVENWHRHSPKTENIHNVWFKFYQDKQFAIIEFGDKFPGIFNFASSGGIAAAKRFCEMYGGFLNQIGPLADGYKAITLNLPLLEPNDVTERRAKE